MKILLIRGSIIVIIALSSIFISFAQESFFPEIPGWKVTQDDPVYNSNNLWDIIDGAADLYLEYSFVNLHIARYYRADSIEIKAELYHHNSNADAFGIYSQERDTSYHFIQIGAQGYLQQGVLNFLTGNYYIKLSAYQTGETVQEALLTIANKINGHLQQNNSLPKVLQMFPLEGKQPNTEQYIARNFLGYSFLNSVYMAAYKDTATFKVFIIEADTPEHANTMITEYIKAVPKDAVTKIDADRYRICDTHNGLIELQIVNRTICGILNCTDNKTRELYLSKLAVNLSN